MEYIKQNSKFLQSSAVVSVYWMVSSLGTWRTLLTVWPIIIPGWSWCNWLWAVEKLCHDWTGWWRGWGHCDRHGHHWKVQPQQTVPLQALRCHGQYLCVCSALSLCKYEAVGITVWIFIHSIWYFQEVIHMDFLLIAKALSALNVTAAKGWRHGIRSDGENRMSGAIMAHSRCY